MFYNIMNDKLSLTSGSKSEETPAVWKNQTANGIVTCSEIMNSYVENSGFPNFVEVIR